MHRAARWVIIVGERRQGDNGARASRCKFDGSALAINEVNYCARWCQSRLEARIPR